MITLRFYALSLPKLVALLLSALCVLSACGGGSDAGSQSNQQPQAKASALGLGEADAGNRYTVRAGAPVLLTGARSDGVDAALVDFIWQAPEGIDLIDRSRSVVLFYAPRQAAQLDFTLTITDSQGDRSVDKVVIDVVEVGDSDDFLQLNPVFDQSLLSFDVIEKDADSSGMLKIVETVSWPGGHSCGEPQTSEAREWLLPIDGGERFRTFDLPEINVDDVNKYLQRPGDIDRQLELNCIDRVEHVLTFSLEINAGDLDVVIAPKPPEPQVTISSGQPYRVNVQDLRQRLGLETIASANNYYALIDPEGQSLTLNGWKAQAGMLDRDDPSQAHAVYVNNYDLGFGRDMFLRADADGNVYSYVENYPGLKGAIDKLGEFVVVAMEYSDNPDDDGDRKKIVKFYAFATDAVSGDSIRIASVNFDGRGEKYIPGVCVACHGGTVDVAGLQEQPPLASAADSNSTFMPFDVHSFLFTRASPPSLVDPDIVADPVSEPKMQQYSLANQQAALRRLNEGVLATFPPDDPRFNAARALIHGWYDSSDIASTTLPENNFNGAFVQEGWVGQEALYQNSFARYCRACHTQLENPQGRSPTPNPIQFDEYCRFISTFKSADAVVGCEPVLGSGAGEEFVYDTYYTISNMPMARMTMDRFWVPFTGQLSAAEALREHLQALDPINAPDAATVPRFDAGSAALRPPVGWAKVEAGVAISDCTNCHRTPGLDAPLTLTRVKNCLTVADPSKQPQGTLDGCFAWAKSSAHRGSSFINVTVEQLFKDWRDSGFKQ
jgi:hypothetical protein